MKTYIIYMLRTGNFEIIEKKSDTYRKLETFPYLAFIIGEFKAKSKEQANIQAKKELSKRLKKLKD